MNGENSRILIKRVILTIGIIFILIFGWFEMHKIGLKDVLNNFDENMWYVTHQINYEDKMFTNDELKNYNIESDEVSLKYYSDMKKFEDYGVKEEQYTDKSKFTSHFNSVYAEKTHMYIYLIIGIIVVIIAFGIKKDK